MTDRRNFLKTSFLGAGAFAFSPYFNGLCANTKETGFPKRFIFLRKSSGLRPHEFALPSFSAADKAKDKNKEALEAALDKHELPDCMGELNDYKEHMTILQGLSSKMSDNGHSSKQSVMGLFKGSNLSNIKRATVDFELAKLFPSPFGHVELSFADNRTGIVPGFSAPGPQQKNYCYADPMTAYNELFKCVINPSLVNSDNDMLQYLKSKEGETSRSFIGKDKNTFNNHLMSIEEIRQRNEKLLKMSGDIRKYMPKIDPIHANGGKGATTPQKQEAMTDVLVAALVTGMTNVVTYTLDTISTVVSGLPGNESDKVDIHGLGHNEAFGGVPAEETRRQIRVQHLKQVKTIVDKLKAQPEGNGTMFDNTMVMYFPEGGETHHGSGIEAPFVILSGKNCQLDIAGRYIRLPFHGTQGHQTLGNWYTSLLNAHGNPIKHYGDLDQTMARKKFDQEGPIKQFMRG